VRYPARSGIAQQFQVVLLDVAALLICYSLSRPDWYEADLERIITSLGRWWHPFESVWLVSTGYRTGEVRDILASQMDPRDQLLVMEVTGQDWTTAGFYPQAEEWLSYNVGRAGGR
jgi:hypothetical protein